MKILVIRFSSIGDIILTTPVLRWLAQLNAEVHYLTKSNYTELVCSNPHIHSTHTLDKNIDLTIDLLKKENFDTVIDLHKNIRSKKVSKALGATYITFNKLNIQKWLFVNFKVNLLPKKHLIDRYAEALKPLHLDTANRGVEYYFPQNFSFDLAKHQLRKKEYLSIVIGGTYTTKQIPFDIILSLINRLNRHVVLLGGGKQDSIKAAKIVAKAPKYVSNLVNKITLTEAAYVIKHSSSVITSDTGLMHIASAFEVPIHTVWGNTHPAFGMYAYRQKNTEIHNYLLDLPCQPCSKLGSHSCPRSHFDCMKKQNIALIVKNCQAADQSQ